MQKKYIDAFNCVKVFVDDLWGQFGNEKSPLPINLYRRLLSKVNERDVEIVNHFLSGFSYFLRTYEDQLLEDRMLDIPKGVRINYKDSKKVYLDIQKYIYPSDEETRRAIRQHLLTISAILAPDQKKLQHLDESGIEDNFGIDETTPEGQLFGDIMHKTRDALGDINSQNPTVALMTLMQGGVLTDLIGSLQEKAEKGEIDVQKLMGVVQQTMTSATQTVQTATVTEIESEGATETQADVNIEDGSDLEDSGDVLVEDVQSIQSSSSEERFPGLPAVVEEDLDFSDFPSEEDMDKVD
jgi:hypothetical protein